MHASQVEVRDRRASDGRAVRRVARRAWRATYEPIAPSGFIATVLRRGYARDRLLLGLTDPARDALVALVDGRLVGFADALEREAGLVELARIYVDPEAQGAGAGSALLARVRAAACARRAHRIEASVDPGNVRALAWYARQGFAVVGRDTFTLGPWVRPTVLLALDLAP
jgi:ribosomal protein S18 acetylase RimI-like enzyme